MSIADEPTTSSLSTVDDRYWDLIAETRRNTDDIDSTPESLALEERVFADGEVTFAEYEEAMSATVVCLRDEGFVVEGPLRYGQGGFLVIAPGVDPSIHLSYFGVDVREPEYSQAAELCDSRWRLRIETVWLGQHEPTAEQIQAWLDAAWECGAEKGISIHDPPDPSLDLSPVLAAGCQPWSG